MGGCSGSSAPLHPISLLQESQTSTHPASELEQHNARACLPRALLSFRNRCLVPTSGLPGPRHLFPLRPRALSCTPTQRPSAGFPDKGRPLGVAGRLLPEAPGPPHRGWPGWDGSPRRETAQPGEPSERPGPAAHRAPAGGRGDAPPGPGLAVGAAGLGRGRRARGRRRRRRGAYCW